MSDDTLLTLRGCFTPLVTPFLDDDEVDLATFDRLVDFQIASGSHGLVVAGTSGEPSLLTVAERQVLTHRAVDRAAGRVPVIAATGSQSLAETEQLTAAAAEAGADALMIVTPYYVKPPQRGLIAYYERVARSTDLPVLIYHIPGRSGVTLDPDSLAAIVSRAPNVLGIKHASTDLSYLSEIRHRLGSEFRIFVGLEELSLPMLAMGACGLVNAAGNVVPDRIVELFQAVDNGDIGRARDCHDALYELNRAVFWDTNPIPVKYLMARVGLLPVNHHRLPMAPVTSDVASRLDALAERLGLEVDMHRLIDVTPSS